MVPDYEFTGVVQDGRFVLDRREAFAYLKGKLEGQRIVLSVRRQRRSRSNSQNAWYWGVAIPLFAEQLGYDQEEMHEALKLKLLPKNLEGEFPTVGSTARLNTTDFAHFMEDVVRLGQEVGLTIPLPDESSSW